MKKTLMLLVILLLICSLNVYAESTEDSSMVMETAIVLEASDVVGTEELEGEYQNVKLKIISGKYKNKIIDVENNLSSNFAYDIIVKDGDKVVVSIEEIEDGNVDVFITDYMRQHYIFY